MRYTTEVHEAAAHGNIPTLNYYIVNQGTNVNERDNSLLTPLMYAAMSGLKNGAKGIRYLISKGANAKLKVPSLYPSNYNWENNNNYNNRTLNKTALIFAVESGKLDAVRELIAHSNLNARDGIGSTALDHALGLAMMTGKPVYKQMASMLLRTGAKVNIQWRNPPDNPHQRKLYDNVRHLVGVEILRRELSKNKIVKNLRKATLLRRTEAMRKQLGQVKINTGKNIVHGLPKTVLHKISKIMETQRQPNSRT